MTDFWGLTICSLLAGGFALYAIDHDARKLAFAALLGMTAFFILAVAMLIIKIGG